jgi:HEAT repeat protein
MVEAGRRKDRGALAALIKALREDSSPVVREAAARGLGLIGDPAGLAALQYAAGADDDREVRHSAAFAADVIRANLPRR